MNNTCTDKLIVYLDLHICCRWLVTVYYRAVIMVTRRILQRKCRPPILVKITTHPFQARDTELDASFLPLSRNLDPRLLESAN